MSTSAAPASSVANVGPPPFDAAETSDPLPLADYVFDEIDSLYEYVPLSCSSLNTPIGKFDGATEVWCGCRVIARSFHLPKKKHHTVGDLLRIPSSRLSPPEHALRLRLAGMFRTRYSGVSSAPGSFSAASAPSPAPPAPLRSHSRQQNEESTTNRSTGVRGPNRFTEDRGRVSSPSARHNGNSTPRDGSNGKNRHNGRRASSDQPGVTDTSAFRGDSPSPQLRGNAARRSRSSSSA
ncbi:unnamed protein product, partial [Scytosiphon promiscuus]